MALFRVDKITKAYQNKRVVDEVDYDVNSGELVGLLGTNGAGKTTSFRIAVGLIRPEHGRVFLDEKEVTRDPIHVRARKGIGYLPQEPSVFQGLSVFDNLEAILEMMVLSPKYRPDQENIRVYKTKKERRARLEEILNELGLWDHRHKYARDLSGGLRRRLEIARTLLLQPKLILLDEPFSGLDPKVVEDLQRLIRQLCRRGIGILLTDHNVRKLLEVTDRAYIMHDGQIRRHGVPDDLVKDEWVRKVYLGERFDQNLQDYRQHLENEA